MNAPSTDGADPSEARLHDYLDELREEPPSTDPRMSDRIVRRARWQHAARGPLQAIGMLFAALAEGVSTLIGADREPRR